VRAPIAPEYLPETLAHTLLLCNHDVYRRRRERFISAITELSASGPALARSRPASDLDFRDPSVLFTIVQQCTGLGSNYGRNGLQGQPDSAPVDPPQHAHQFQRDSERARKTVAWMSPLFHDWMNVIRDPTRPERPETTPGYRLAELAGKFVRDMFRLRESIIASNADSKAAFRTRSRDPVRADPPPDLPNPQRNRREEMLHAISVYNRYRLLSASGHPQFRPPPAPYYRTQPAVAAQPLAPAPAIASQNQLGSGPLVPRPVVARLSSLPLG